MTHQIPRWFTVTKYLIYCLLGLNILLFLQEETTTAAALFKQGFTLELFIQAFSATIDTVAWVVLLLMFELETYVLPDDAIQGPTRWALHGLRIVAFLFIGSACFGYFEEMFYYQIVSPLAGDACQRVGEPWSVLVKLDEFVALTAESCRSLQGQLWQVGGAEVLTDDAGLRRTRWLAFADVINSIAWILVVLLLEIDVRLQLRGRYEGRALTASKLCKVVLYGILFAAAVFWWFEGDFLDFWDAFLWLFAFFFIEQNLFFWQAETEAEQAELPVH
ncbi:MAG: hypothetical protein V2J89_11160 [Halieaceae bacterium]|jgi:hypothetical protein|nr:hypothetical protein [Halieaceae bacterium]